MRASEVINKYALGERNFQGANLRGLSFKGKNLSGVDFSGADIRGTKFTEVNLTGANFRNAKAGLQIKWTISLVLFSWLLSVLSGFIAAFASGYLGFLLVSDNIRDVFAGLATLVGLFVVSVITVRHNLVVALVALAVLATFAMFGALPFAGRGTGSGAGSFAFAIVGATIGVFVLALALSGAFVIAKTSGFNVSEVFALAGAFTFSMFGRGAVVQARSFALVCSFSLILLSVYISWRAMKGDLRCALVRTFAINFAATGGTSFRKANLTDTNFTGARLKSTDMREAILIRTHWQNAEKLDRVRPGNSYLKYLSLLPWLVGKGTEKNFDKHELRGVNLQGANLSDASFIGADLSEANLQDANLSRAKLVQTQLDQTDFTGATLTGAFIEDWGITHQTKFDGVRCEYVFMRLPTPENPDPWRKPDNRKEVFADGDFGDFIKPIVDTLDLYHNQNVDPRAIAVSFKQLAENNPDAEIEIVAMERRGEDKFLIRAKTKETADKSQLSKEYFQIYNQNRALEQKNSNLLTAIAEKNDRIASLETAINLALQRPSFYAETCHNQGEKNMSGDRNINTGGGNYNEKIEGDYVQGNKGDTINQSGTFGIGVNKSNIQSGAKVGGIINESQPQNLAEAAKEIQQLLEQLEKTYPTDTFAGKVAIANETIQNIDSNPKLTSRVLSALQAGGTSALDSFLDHPAASFVIGALEDWQQSKGG